ncbi:Gfo/Idh/MocA family oxidoreductase [Evansella sp. AB-P1]|uniref:Gfo/Idh/MocA family protein n=1 Tax=Evansella sp. AB-P1 TaxID=3037653 RepID=UPI00241C7D68|nr:Gfo/Idh/MocA family oxidoreductase [Evansella sp. AB-P1]MDG5786141.1 Gfo/Idh/MocA family oxidoreductase [Evansella sp. AB-P1]
MKVRFGVLGYARIAENSVIPPMLESDFAEFYALASSSEEKRKACKEKFDCKRIYESYEELLEDKEIQAVYIPLPNSLHKEWAIKAMEKGKHVLCEKPMALNETEALEMIEVSKKNNVILMEAFMYKYTSRIQLVEEVLEKGILGEIKHITSSFRFFLNRPNTIKMQPELGGGALYDVGCYPLNFVGMVMNQEPSDIHVVSEMKEGVDVSASVLLQYSSGATATLNAGFNAFPRNYSEIIGTKGRIEIPDTFTGKEGKLFLYTDEKEEEIYVPPSSRYQLEVDDFSRSILNGKEPLISLEESLRNIRVMDRILEKVYF